MTPLGEREVAETREPLTTRELLAQADVDLQNTSERLRHLATLTHQLPLERQEQALNTIAQIRSKTASLLRKALRSFVMLGALTTQTGAEEVTAQPTPSETPIINTKPEREEAESAQKETLQTQHLSQSDAERFLLQIAADWKAEEARLTEEARRAEEEAGQTAMAREALESVANSRMFQDVYPHLQLLLQSKIYRSCKDCSDEIRDKILAAAQAEALRQGHLFDREGPNHDGKKAAAMYAAAGEPHFAITALIGTGEQAAAEEFLTGTTLNSTSMDTFRILSGSELNDPECGENAVAILKSIIRDKNPQDLGSAQFFRQQYAFLRNMSANFSEAERQHLEPWITYLGQTFATHAAE